jgi:hypothetical protein
LIQQKRKNGLFMAFVALLFAGVLGGSQNPIALAAVATTPEEYREGMVLEINLRMRDDEGARWEFNADPVTKNIQLRFTSGCTGFGTIGTDCWILSPRAYQRGEDWNVTGLDPLAPIQVDPTTFYLPQEGTLQVGIPDGVTEVSVELTDPTGNFVSIEAQPTGATDTGITIEKSANLDRNTLIGTGQFQELNFYVTRDDLNNRLRPGDIPIGVFNQFITNVGQFSRRAASMLGWSLEITEEGFRNDRIEEVTLIIRDVVNGIIILTIIGLAFMWIFSALLHKNVLRTTTALVALSALAVNFAMPIVRIVLDGVSVVQKTFLTDEIKEERFLRIENISDVWVGTGVAIMQPRIIQEGETDIQGQVAIDDRYVDMRQESTIFHGILLFALSLGEAFVAILLALRIVILWFFLIFSPFFAVLPIFRFTRGVFRYWFWLFGRWLFLGPLIAICLYISISLWQHTGIPIESTFEGFAGTQFLSNTTNIQMYAPGVIRGAGGNMTSATELMKFIIGTLMIWYSAIIPFWLTRSKILSNCCPQDKKKKIRGSFSSYSPTGIAPPPALPPSEPKNPRTPQILPKKSINPKIFSQNESPSPTSRQPDVLRIGAPITTGKGQGGQASQKQDQNLFAGENDIIAQTEEKDSLIRSSVNAAFTGNVQGGNFAGISTRDIIREIEESPTTNADTTTTTNNKEYTKLQSEIEERANTGDLIAQAYVQGEDFSAKAEMGDVTGNVIMEGSSSLAAEKTSTDTTQTTKKEKLEKAVSLEDINTESSTSETRSKKGEFSTTEDISQSTSMQQDSESVLESSVSEKESSDISQESASTVSAEGSSVMGEGASSSSADVSSNVEQQETVEDYVESSRSQEQSQKRSMEMEEDYSQESSVSAQEQSSVSAEEEYSATETSDTSQVASAESVSSSESTSSSEESSVSEMESSDISQESASTVSAEGSSVMERRSQQQFCRCVVECGAARDRGRLCRILAFARAESRTIDGNGRRLFTREFGFGTRAEFGFCGRRIQRNRNVRYFSGCECRKCFEFGKYFEFGGEFGFGNGKQ